MSADINKTASAIDAFVRTFKSAAVTAKDVQVRPSGDDVDVIKVWIDLGAAKVDTQAWGKALEAAIKQDVPDASAFQLAVRVEAE